MDFRTFGKKSSGGKSRKIDNSRAERDGRTILLRKSQWRVHKMEIPVGGNVVDIGNLKKIGNILLGEI